MCGILAVLGCIDNSQAKRSRIIELSRRLRHRGPDWSGLHCHQDCYLAHQRLAIVDPTSGDQPLYNEDKTVVVTVNGEIYNHKQLREKLTSHQFRTGSDCEVIAHLNKTSKLHFSVNHFLSFPDVVHVHLYYHFLINMSAGELRRWYNPPWYSEHIPSTPYDPLVLREAFEKAVIKRLMTDVPFGVLLSGGLDSSLVASVASRYMLQSEAACQWGSQLHTFCIGLKGSPDLKAAREVANYLGTRHHEFHFTVQEGLDALEEVIYHTETYDVTTIRASTPMFLMSRKIKSLGVKMVLSGEGSDEIFGGYLYFHKAPNKEEFHQETCRKIKALHLYDCLRANKSTSAWGVEARVPFLDKEFINIAMSIDPEWKMVRPDLGRIEKWVLRNAFDDDQKPYLPKHILYRQKEQFSDGVGYSWIDGLKDHANEHVTDAMLMNASFVYPENTPTTKEGYYYRAIFEKFFPKNAARSTVPGGPSIACSTAKAVEWDAAWSKNPDPSGRAALGVHECAYEEAVDEKNANLINGTTTAI
ncbi:hypothetical protein PVL29_026562 [Vitis rotundifolia]|uniref:Asparagine synthetase [glutamine-hydrolyzing] n=1 Tax=Vitis rotundifolia TaxID=103349 RepID=A0AA38YGL6_VITRO|nr:hypothetical protein PVL29_026562 [Vitis rotundifolia]